MGITLDALHQPLNDFFLSQFQTEDGADVMFRFDKFGSVLSDEDFVDDAHPDVESPTLAVEKFSDLVNRVPTDAGDNLNVVLSADSIDSAYYFRLLSPSMPYIPAGTDDAARDSITATFFALKREAMLTWENIRLESLGGLMLQYKPSTATPEDWFDRTKQEAWTNRTFQISPPAAPAPAANPAPQVVWKMKLSDAALANITVPEAVVPVRTDPPDQPDPVIEAVPVESKVSRAALFQPALKVSETAFNPALANVALDAAPMRLASRRKFNLADVLVNDGVALTEAPAVAAVSRPALDHQFMQQYRALDVKERLWVNQYVDDNAPAEPAKATGVSIAFDYCLVKIRRPWLVDAFINLPSWWAPSTPKGSITTPGQAGAVPLLPIAFVAIRNLLIEANWTAADLAAAAQAVSFGPFKISPDIVAGKIAHPGLQIVGWLLQRLPPLPPQDAPA